MSGAQTNNHGLRTAARVVVVLAALFVFLMGIQGISTGVKGLGQSLVGSVMAVAGTPFAGLIAGVLATSLVQSSSVTTSTVVGMVAGGVLPLEAAIPVVMGANIGTTVTSTIAAMAQLGRPTEFRRAFAAATCHDFFNYFVVLFLLPVEIVTGFLATSSAYINELLPAASGAAYKSPIKQALKSAVKLIQAGIETIATDRVAAVILLVISLALIIASLGFLVSSMKKLLQSRLERTVQRFFVRGALGGSAAIILGIVLTVSVQSSSVTTSMMVPIAGAGLMRLRQVFPVAVGANIGTTCTALLASMAVTGSHAAAGRQIALVHLLFNLTGMLVFYVPRWTRKFPMRASVWLAKVAVSHRKWAVAYVLGLFYGVPALLVVLFR